MAVYSAMSATHISLQMHNVFTVFESFQSSENQSVGEIPNPQNNGRTEGLHSIACCDGKSSTAQLDVLAGISGGCTREVLIGVETPFRKQSLKSLLK
jgi:hypothetical protein